MLLILLVCGNGIAFDRNYTRDLAALLLGYRDNTAALGDNSRLLRRASLEQLLDARKTLRDVRALRHRPYGRFSSSAAYRLADGLSCDDTDRLADADRLARRHVGAVAVSANAVLALTFKDSSYLDLINACVDDLLCLVVAHESIGGNEHLSGLGIDNIMAGIASDKALCKRLDNIAVFVNDGADNDTGIGTAVGLGDDNILRNIDKTTGKVTGVGGLKSRIRQRLTRAARCDEVLEDIKTLTEVRLGSGSPSYDRLLRTSVRAFRRADASE